MKETKEITRLFSEKVKKSQRKKVNGNILIRKENLGRSLEPPSDNWN